MVKRQAAEQENTGWKNRKEHRLANAFSFEVEKPEDKIRTEQQPVSKQIDYKQLKGTSDLIRTTIEVQNMV